MILIKKSKEPQKWTEYRSTPGVDYQAIPELVDSLLKEQGYICAYCMRRIPTKDRVYNKDGVTFSETKEDHRVEHIKSRVKHDDLKLNYTNMVICCPGHIGDEPHCDRLKGSEDISSSPLDTMFINTLSYTTDGKIESSNHAYQTEIENILNLNTKLLMLGRKEARDEAIKNVNYLCKKNGTWNKAAIERCLAKYDNMHVNGNKKEYYPYCGIISWYLRKKLKQLS